MVLISMRHRMICFFEKGMIYNAILKKERMHYNDILEIRAIIRKGPTTYTISLKSGKEFQWSEQEFVKLDVAMATYGAYMGNKRLKEVL